MNVSCPICIDLFDGNDVVGATCGHVFHSKCIYRWIDENRHACPTCRKQLSRNKIFKLYFNETCSGTFQSDPCLRNELDSLKAEVKAKENELSVANKKIKDIQKYVAEAEAKRQVYYNDMLEAQTELNIAKARLRQISKLEAQIHELTKENSHLKKQVINFQNIQLILEGSQQDAEEVLQQQKASMAQEVGGIVSKNMAALCSILKRELLNVKAEKEMSRKREYELMLQIGIQEAKIEKLNKTEEDYRRLKRKMMEKSASPQPIPSSSNAENDKSTSYIHGQGTPANLLHGRKSCTATSSKASEDSDDLTPITVSFTKRPLKNVIVNNGPVSAANPRPTRPLPVGYDSFPHKITCRRDLDDDEDSVTRVGYNGLGGHERVIRPQPRKVIFDQSGNTKPYRRNPNVKKAK